MSYQSADASQNMELKKGNIASFFKTGAGPKAVKSGVKTSTAGSGDRQPVMLAQRQKEEPGAATNTDIADKHYMRLNTSNASSAADLASDAHGDKQHIRQSQSHSVTQSAGPQVKNEVIALAGSDPGKAKPEEGDVLNTDDAGGIGEPVLQL